MKQIGSIQILRAVAALMVVLAHAQDDAAHEALKAGVVFGRSQLVPWVAGVDLFFVISGFVMVVASERLFGTPGAASTFLLRRIVRIVPLYWLVTGIWLVILVLLSRHGEARLPGLAEIVTSLAFVPYARPLDGVARPIVSLGWTLEYEMLFYIVFAGFLRWRREPAVGGVAVGLGLLVALGALWHPTETALAYWSDPIVIEFALGMGLALAWRRGFRLPRPVAAGIAGLAIVALALDLARMTAVPPFGVDPSGFGRLLACGVPMAALLGAIVLARREATGAAAARLGRLVVLGDASYALYLLHPLVIVALRKVYLAVRLGTQLGFWPLVAGEIVVASAVAVAVHLLLEKPVTAALQGRLARRPRQVPLGLPLPSSR